MHPQGSTKAPASPHTTRAGGVDRVTGTQAECRGEGAAESQRYCKKHTLPPVLKDGSKFNLLTSQSKG